LRRLTGWLPRYSLGASLTAILESAQEGGAALARKPSL